MLIRLIYLFGTAPSDGDCCPTGRATTTWTYTGGRLLPGKAHVTAR
jgi:hypothetical protein